MPVVDTHPTRGVIYYEWSWGSKATEACDSINAALGKGCVSYETVRRWFISFSNGEIDMEDKPRTGRPHAFDDETLLSAVRADPETTMRELAKRNGQAPTTVNRRLHEPGYGKVLSRWTSCPDGCSRKCPCEHLSIAAAPPASQRLSRLSGYGR